jgi:hypothetical protein
MGEKQGMSILFKHFLKSFGEEGHNMSKIYLLLYPPTTN